MQLVGYAGGRGLRTDGSRMQQQQQMAGRLLALVSLMLCLQLSALSSAPQPLGPSALQLFSSRAPRFSNSLLPGLRDRTLRARVYGSAAAVPGMNLRGGSSAMEDEGAEGAGELKKPKSISGSNGAEGAEEAEGAAVGAMEDQESQGTPRDDGTQPATGTTRGMGTQEVTGPEGSEGFEVTYEAGGIEGAEEETASEATEGIQETKRTKLAAGQGSDIERAEVQQTAGAKALGMSGRGQVAERMPEASRFGVQEQRVRKHQDLDLKNEETREMEMMNSAKKHRPLESSTIDDDNFWTDAKRNWLLDASELDEEENAPSWFRSQGVEASQEIKEKAIGNLSFGDLDAEDLGTLRTLQSWYRDDTKDRLQKMWDKRLLKAIKAGRADMFMFLVGKGANPNCLVPDDNARETALHVAASRGNLDVVSVLLDLGANFSTQDVAGNSPLHDAALNGNSYVVTRLLEAGADINCANALGLTALHVAAANGHVSAVKALLALNAEVNITTPSGSTPLRWAALKGHFSVVAILLEHGAAVNTPSDQKATLLREVEEAKAKQNSTGLNTANMQRVLQCLRGEPRLSSMTSTAVGESETWAVGERDAFEGEQAAPRAQRFEQPDEIVIDDEGEPFMDGRRIFRRLERIRAQDWRTQELQKYLDDPEAYPSRDVEHLESKFPRQSCNNSHYLQAPGENKLPSIELLLHARQLTEAVSEEAEALMERRGQLNDGAKWPLRLDQVVPVDIHLMDQIIQVQSDEEMDEVLQLPEHQKWIAEFDKIHAGATLSDLGPPPTVLPDINPNKFSVMDAITARNLCGCVRVVTQNCLLTDLQCRGLGNATEAEIEYVRYLDTSSEEMRLPWEPQPSLDELIQKKREKWKRIFPGLKALQDEDKYRDRLYIPEELQFDSSSNDDSQELNCAWRSQEGIKHFPGHMFPVDLLDDTESLNRHAKSKSVTTAQGDDLLSLD